MGPLITAEKQEGESEGRRGSLFFSQAASLRPPVPGIQPQRLILRLKTGNLFRKSCHSGPLPLASGLRLEGWRLETEDVRFKAEDRILD